MTTRGKLLGWILLGLVGVIFGQGCGSSSDRQFRKPAPAAGTGGKDSGTMTVEPQGGLGGDGNTSPYDVLCGIEDDGCNPDDATSSVCKPSIGGATPAPGGRGGGGSSGGITAGQGGESAASGAAAASGAPADAGQGGAPAGGQGGESPSQAGAGGEAVDNGGNESTGGEAGSAAGASSAGRTAQGGGSGRAAATAGSAGITVSTLSLTSCQVTEDPKRKGRPMASCMTAGNGMEGDPCFSGADCRAGLACVGDGPGQCRPYCCAGGQSCRDRTHCSAEPLVLPSSKATLEAPVCMPVVNCSLAERPCEAGATCSCPVDTACVVVGNDGTTTCVKTSTLPTDGDGEEGMACPCAWGLVCSQATDTCVKLCQVAAPESYCDGARCQPSTALPDGWGTCVGVPPKGMKRP